MSDNETLLLQGICNRLRDLRAALLDIAGGVEDHMARSVEALKADDQAMWPNDIYPSPKTGEGL